MCVLETMDLSKQTQNSMTKLVVHTTFARDRNICIGSMTHRKPQLMTWKNHRLEIFTHHTERRELILHAGRRDKCCARPIPDAHGCESFLFKRQGINYVLSGKLGNHYFWRLESMENNRTHGKQSSPT